MPNPVSAEKALTNAIGFVPIAGTVRLYDNQTRSQTNIFFNLPLRKIEWDGDQLKIGTSSIPKGRKFYLLYNLQYDRLLAVSVDNPKETHLAYWQFTEGSIGTIPEPLPTCEFNHN